jgi:REP-associated tyrosine transposase
MARPLRLEFPGAIYHLTGRGNARQKVFFTDADRELFLLIFRVRSLLLLVVDARCEA